MWSPESWIRKLRNQRMSSYQSVKSVVLKVSMQAVLQLAQRR